MFEKKANKKSKNGDGNSSNLHKSFHSTPNLQEEQALSAAAANNKNSSSAASKGFPPVSAARTLSQERMCAAQQLGGDDDSAVDIVVVESRSDDNVQFFIRRTSPPTEPPPPPPPAGEIVKVEVKPSSGPYGSAKVIRQPACKDPGVTTTAPDIQSSFRPDSNAKVYASPRDPAYASPNKNGKDAKNK